uniref:Uncharacterized protein n=1 Tax=Rhizophora mucronata TaxID=61149 RepID=A0A2P2PKX2_RHIMU
MGYLFKRCFLLLEVTRLCGYDELDYYFLGFCSYITHLQCVLEWLLSMSQHIVFML